MQLMSQDLQLRRNGGGRFNNDQVARINQIIGSSKSAQEALLKRCSSFLIDADSGVSMQSPITCEHLIDTRKQQLHELVDDMRSKLKLAAWLFQQLGEPHKHFEDFVRNVSQHNFGDAEVTNELEPIIDTVMRESTPDDWNDFFVSAEEIEAIKQATKAKNAGNSEKEDAEYGQAEENKDVAACAAKNEDCKFAVDAVREHNAESRRSTKRVKLQMNAVAVTRQSNLQKDLSWPLKPRKDDLAPTLREVSMTLRSLAREWVFRYRALRFLGCLRSIQSNNYLPACSVCGYQTEDSTQLHVLGHCGHISCDTCVKSVIDKEECTVSCCRGVAPKYRVIKASMLGRDESLEGPSFGGSKLDALVQLLKDPSRIPDDECVIVFCQFPEVQEAAAKALELASIPRLVIGPADRGAAEKVQEFQASKVKVLILNMGGENAAGL